MKKKITLYYDDENDDDIALLEYIDDIKGKSSRTAFIMNTLYDFKNGKLTYEKTIAPQYQIIQADSTNKKENNNIPENKINKDNINDFKKRFGK